MIEDRRFIEESFPVKEVSIESAKEKSIRHGHISTLHIWWARRPLASSRATNYAALIPAVSKSNKIEYEQKRKFIAELSKWNNSLNQDMIEQARRDIFKANNGRPPKVLDPFAGGGAIPLEALRLGCETYSNDYNPVAVLIQKCTLEYPQKYGKPFIISNKPTTLFPEPKKQEILDLNSKVIPNRLLYDVKKWGNWVLNEAKKELEKFYPPDPDGAMPVGYIWARTIPCQNPSCGAEIPLMRQFWLAKKKNKKVALYPYTEGKEVLFKIVGDGYEKMPQGFDPSKGTISRAVVICPVCGSVIDAKKTRRIFQTGKSGERLISVILDSKSNQTKGLTKGKKYRIATTLDNNVFTEAKKYLRIKTENIINETGIDPIPNEPIPLMSGVFNAPIYKLNKWGDIFNFRQKLALITFTEKVKLVYKGMIKEVENEEYIQAVVSYLALGLSRVIDYFNTLCVWDNGQERTVHVFGRQALPMVWDYSELNPISSTVGSWESMAFRRIWKVIEFLSKINSSNFSTVSQSSATDLGFPENFFDAIFTDPPYYFNVPYADLSDFFYVWLKRIIGDIIPELFSTPLTPKSKEIVQMEHWDKQRYPEKNKEWFEKMLTKSFKEIHRVLKPGGIATIVYAHKSTEGWETLINSLLDSGLVVTASWPINTEMKERLRANESAALASSIYIVARKAKRGPTGFYNNIKEELRVYLYDKLEKLWNEGISGADFFISAIGSAIEIFGKYEKIIDYEGNVIRASQMLADVRSITTDYAVHQILHNGFAGEISNLTRFYVLYRWGYGEAKLPFDEANKLSRSANVALDKEWSRPGFIKKDKEFIRVLGPQDRKIEEITNSTELIDVLHTVLLFWEKGKREEYIDILNSSGYGINDSFYRVAQTISETLPNDSKEKKLLDGFLSGKTRVQEEIKNWKSDKQSKLF